MNEITFEQFEMDAENIMRAAATGDQFTAVQMHDGKAIIINEDEWKILRDAFAMLLKIKT